MPTFRATHSNGSVVEYESALPRAEHLTENWRLEEILVAEIVVVGGVEVPLSTVYNGRRNLTKLEFIDLLGATAYKALLQLAKSSVDIEAWIKQFDLAPIDAQGFSVNLDSMRTINGLRSLEPVLISIGMAAPGWADGVLNG